jgi:uncharacterized integral membrane protein
MQPNDDSRPARTENAAPSAAPVERKTYQGTGVWPVVVVGLLLAAAVVIFIAQNAHAVAMKFLWVHFRTSPAVLMLATAVIAIGASAIAGAVWRRRRRRILSEREELEALRAGATTT